MKAFYVTLTRCFLVMVALALSSPQAVEAQHVGIELPDHNPSYTPVGPAANCPAAESIVC